MEARSVVNPEAQRAQQAELLDGLGPTRLIKGERRPFLDPVELAAVRAGAAALREQKDHSAGLAAVGNDTGSSPTETASGAVSLPNCVVLSRAWMEAYVRSQESFDTRELDAFVYGAADLLGQVVLEYEALFKAERSSPAGLAATVSVGNGGPTFTVNPLMDALRALVEKWYDPTWYLEYGNTYDSRDCADQLAALLTPSAEEERCRVYFRDVPGVCDLPLGHDGAHRMTTFTATPSAEGYG